jgi:hypothetical protein
MDEVMATESKEYQQGYMDGLDGLPYKNRYPADSVQGRAFHAGWFAGNLVNNRRQSGVLPGGKLNG